LQFDAPVWGAISDHAKDLLQQLLCVDQNDRLSVHEALEHRWLKVNFEFFIAFVDVTNAKPALTA
jgi:serine/threonine protein kinase